MTDKYIAEKLKITYGAGPLGRGIRQMSKEYFKSHNWYEVGAKFNNSIRVFEREVEPNLNWWLVDKHVNLFFELKKLSAPHAERTI